jgi:hypothetical protein
VEERQPLHYPVFLVNSANEKACSPSGPQVVPTTGSNSKDRGEDDVEMMMVVIMMMILKMMMVMMMVKLNC